MQYAAANILKYSMIEELLKLLQAIFPQENSLPKNLYSIKTQFNSTTILEKPKMELLFQPVVGGLNILCIDGISLLTHEGLKVIQAKVLIGVFDMIAKVSIVGIKQFNGKCGWLPSMLANV